MLNLNHPVATVSAARPTQPAFATAPVDRRPRVLRWLLPTACATSVPLNPMHQARVKLAAYH